MGLGYIREIVLVGLVVDPYEMKRIQQNTHTGCAGNGAYPSLVGRGHRCLSSLMRITPPPYPIYYPSMYVLAKIVFIHLELVPYLLGDAFHRVLGDALGVG